MITTDTITIAGTVLFGTLLVGAVVFRSTAQGSSQIKSLENAVRSALTENADQVGGAVSEQTETLEQSQAELNELGKRYEELFAEMETATRSFSAAVETVDDFEGLREWNKTLEDAAEPVRRIADDVETWHDEQRQLLGETTEVLTQWATQRQHVESVYEDSVENLERWQEAHTTSLREQSEEIKSQMQTVSKNSQQMQQTLDALEESIESQSDVREQLNEQLPTTVTNLSELIDGLDDLNNRQGETIRMLDEVAAPLKEAATEFGKSAEATLEATQAQADRNKELAARTEAAQVETTEAVTGLHKSVEQLQSSLSAFEDGQTSAWIEYTKVLLLAGILVGLGAQYLV